MPRMRRDVGRLSHDRNRLCLPPASGHLVFGAIQPAELVDPDLPDRAGERHGLPSPILDTGVRNGSRRYDYDEWNRTSRYSAAQHIKSDTRDQPKPEEPVELDPQVRVVPEAGGVLLFSGNQLHSTVPNTSGRTRFSIDFGSSTSTMWSRVAKPPTSTPSAPVPRCGTSSAAATSSASTRRSCAVRAGAGSKGMTG